ncbi:MAG: c-type cytochrome [Candidatus Binataceae bacterium]
MKRFGAHAAALAVALALATSARAEPPQNLYMLNCWGCHRPNGEGIPGTAPPLHDAADFLRVPGGRKYLIRVPGVAQSSLNDADTAAVMNWIIENFSKGRVPPDFKPYTAEEIHQSRAQQHLLDITDTRNALVGKMVALKIRPSAGE